MLTILTGSHLERRRVDGTLEPLTVGDMASCAYYDGHQWFCPQETWTKDYPDQITIDRVGRPVIRLCPMSWLSSDTCAAVMAEIDAQRGVK